MAVDLEVITRTYEEVAQEDLRYASTERLVLTDVPNMMAEIQSLRAELAEHRSRIRMKEEMVHGHE